jgi:hypothetical protein
LLIVIYERLGKIHDELREMTGQLKEARNGSDAHADAKATAHAR